MTDLSKLTTDELVRLYEEEKTRLSGGKRAVMPVGLQKDEDADVDIFATAKNINSSLMGVRNQIADNALALGPVKNKVSEVRNVLGVSDPNSRNYASFRATMEKLRNDSLRLNKGVQTEGDATRAWNELMANINDSSLVNQRLQEIEQINSRAAKLREDVVQTRRRDRLIPERDLSPFTITDQGSRQNPFKLKQGESRTSIPRGAYYTDPAGRLRRNDNFDAGNPIVGGEKASPAKAMSDDDIKKALGL